MRLLLWLSGVLAPLRCGVLIGGVLGIWFNHNGAAALLAMFVAIWIVDGLLMMANDRLVRRSDAILARNEEISESNARTAEDNARVLEEMREFRRRLQLAARFYREGNIAAAMEVMKNDDEGRPDRLQ